MGITNLKGHLNLIILYIINIKKMLSEVILGTTFLLFFIYMGMSVFDKVGKKWTRKSQMDKVEERYEALRSSRREMLVNFFLLFFFF